MVARPNPLPSGGLTVHVIGDVHAGPTASNEPWRLDAVIRDSNRDRMPTPAAVVQVGDGCNNNPAVDTPILEHFLDRLGAPWWAVMGNHDINEEVQTPAQWAARLGYPAPNYVVDLDGLRLVMFSPSAAWAAYDVASPASLAWLNTAIGGTENPVYVVCHFPLHNTVMGVAGVDALSTEVPFYLRTVANPGNSNDILDVLAAHPNLKAWLSGHTHSRIDLPGLVKGVEHNGHRFAAINASTIWYAYATPYPLDARDTINTLYVTLLEDRVEVRVRDHGAGQWASPNGNQVWTVDGL